MTDFKYEDWLGEGKSKSGMVNYIDANKHSGAELDPNTEWGSLKEYVPQGSTTLGAERLIGKDNKGWYLKVMLTGNWHEQLPPKVQALKFRFPKDPVYNSTHPSLAGYTIHRMESDEQVEWDVDEWEPIAKYRVELFRAITPNQKEINYSLKFYFKKIKGSKPPQGSEVGAFWCWPH